MRPRFAAPALVYWGLVGLVAASLAACVFSMPLQVSDNLDKVIAAADHPLGTTLRQSSTADKLRPGSAFAAYLLSRPGLDNPGMLARSVNAFLAAAAMVLLAALLRPATARDVAFALAAVMFFAGHLAFWETFAEGYPVNHFAVVVICLLTILVVIDRQWAGAAAIAATLVATTLAVYTVELGVVTLAALAISASLGRHRRQRGLLIGAGAIAAVYVVSRLLLLEPGGRGLGGHSSGFGLVTLSTGEIVARFGAQPLVWAAHNAAVSLVSLALSEPFNGRWDIVARYVDGSLRVVDIARIAGALSAFGLLAVGGRRWLASRQSGVGPRPLAPLLMLLAVAVVCAALNYGYVKTVFMAPALACYCWALYSCARALAASAPVAALAATVIVSTAAAVPVADIPCESWLRASTNQDDWATALLDDKYSFATAAGGTVAARYRVDALRTPVPHRAHTQQAAICWTRYPRFR
jgi:hypothetical protein